MSKGKTVAARFGERMIEIKIKFWTNNIARSRGQVVPKRAWDSGMVLIERNAAHGIVPRKPLPFHGVMDLSRAIAKVLVAQGITLQLNAKSRKLLTSPASRRNK